MDTIHRFSGTVLLLSFLGLAGLLAAPELGISASGASDKPKAGTTDRPAQSATLQACLSHIPKDATRGQRAVAERTCQRDEAVRKAVVKPGTAAETSIVASGTQGDTLQTCLARIPKNATAGQRMVAERTCQRDEANRKEILVTPGAQ